MAYTVTFTANTFVNGTYQTTGNTLSVDDATARALVDIGVATASGLTAQTGNPTTALTDIVLQKSNNLSDLSNITTAKANLGLAYVNVDIQTFGSPTTSGSFTWTKPAGAKWVRVYVMHSGGGGGSGGRYATTSGRCGGSGGSGGHYSLGEFDAASLPTNVSINVPAGANGGASVLTDTTAGNAGSNSSGQASFGTYLTTINPGFGGAGGTTTAGSGTSSAGHFSIFTNSLYSTGAGGAGGIGSGTNGSGTSTSNVGSAGGGGGGGASASSTIAGNGGFGGARTGGVILAVTAAARGTGTGFVAPANGANATFLGYQGMGAGGGGYITGVAGQAGAEGGWPSGGGGGGSASDNGFPSGAGGKGGNGAVIVITYF